MPLNKQKGNMYSFVTHTWNPIRGKCPHGCEYCYIDQSDKGEPHLIDSEMKTDLGEGRCIFVGSSIDIFALRVHARHVISVLRKCREHDNKYLFQTKAPHRFIDHLGEFPERSVLCATIESNRHYYGRMGKTPLLRERAAAMRKLFFERCETMVTIEPIIDFDVEPFVAMIHSTMAKQINIGADSKRHGLPEPKKEKVMKLITELEKDHQVYIKDNLYRIY